MEGILLIITLTYIVLFLKLYSYICTMEWLRNGQKFVTSPLGVNLAARGNICPLGGMFTHYRI
jgi:hypothetical protein